MNNISDCKKKLDVDPRRDDDASLISSYGCMLRPTWMFMDRMIAPMAPIAHLAPLVEDVRVVRVQFEGPVVGSKALLALVVGHLERSHLDECSDPHLRNSNGLLHNNRKETRAASGSQGTK